MKNMLKLLLSVLLLSSLSSQASAKNNDHKKNKCCKHKYTTPNLAFEADLSFEQLLMVTEEHQGGGMGHDMEGETEMDVLVPRPASDAPKGSGNGVHGKLQLCFAEDLSHVTYRLFVYGLVAPQNKNELITQVHIHAGRASQNGPHVTDLYIGAPIDGCGLESNGLFKEGVIINSNIMPHVSPDGNSYNSIASLLDGVRRGEIYINVHGSTGCNPNGVKYGHGLIRGQVFAKETSS